MNKKLILNLITLATTTLLLVLVVFSWYVTNREVRASGITARTEDGNFTLELERGTYTPGEGGTVGTWTWQPADSVTISNMQPNDVFFFRFKITTNNSGSLKVMLSGISSEIAEGLVTLGSDNESVLIGGAKYFELTNNSVIIKNGSTELGTLYIYSNGKFELDDFLVENTFDYYDYGIGTENFYRTGTTFYTDDVTECPNEPEDLTDITATYTNLPANSIRYGYFALEFDNEKSEETYTHLDGVSKKDSNLYQAQILAIKNISVEALV